MNLILAGIKLQVQKKILNQWMGCARYIWNAKTHEAKELSRTLNKEDTYPKMDCAYAHFKSKEDTPWLYDVPSHILRNSIANSYKTYQKPSQIQHPQRAVHPKKQDKCLCLHR